MKWPESVTLIRHDQSAYNQLASIKKESPLYQEFVSAFETNPDSDRTRELALQVKGELSLKCADHNTPLAKGAGIQAETMATNLQKRINLPDVVFVSPYDRTMETLRRMTIGWPELSQVKTVIEDRITEQDHGSSILFSDWRVFHTIYPDQRELFKMQGEYRYRYPQGENIPDVRERLRSWTTTLVRDYHEQDVLAVTHHLTILSFRANLERLDEKEFLRLDQQEKPINAGVTIYKGKKDQGKNGRLVLDTYNAKLY
jgi:broad specificity phosphatase PhoE